MIQAEGISKYYGKGEINLEKLRSGEDIILVAPDLSLEEMTFSDGLTGQQILFLGPGDTPRRALNSRYSRVISCDSGLRFIHMLPSFNSCTQMRCWDNPISYSCQGLFFRESVSG